MRNQQIPVAARRNDVVAVALTAAERDTLIQALATGEVDRDQAAPLAAMLRRAAPVADVAIRLAFAEADE